MKKIITRGISALLVAALTITSFNMTNVSAATSTYVPSLGENVIKIDITGNDISADENIQFELLQTTDNHPIAEWTHGDEQNGSVYFQFKNLSKSDNYTLPIKVNLKELIADSSYREMYYYTYSAVNKKTGESAFYDNWLASSQEVIDMTVNNRFDYTINCEYKYTPTAKDYSIPANTVYMVNTEQRENTAAVKIGDKQYRNTGTMSAPKKLKLPAGSYYYAAGMVDTCSGRGTNDMCTYDTTKYYHKVKYHLADLYPKTFTDNGRFILPDTYKKAINRETAPIGCSSYTVNKKQINFEAQLTVLSGSFVQHPNIDKNGDIEIYMMNDTNFAYMFINYLYDIVDGGWAYGGGPNHIHYDTKEKSIPLNLINLDTSSGMIISGLYPGKFRLVQKSSGPDRKVISDQLIEVKDSGTLQTFSIKLNDKGGEPPKTDQPTQPSKPAQQTTKPKPDNTVIKPTKKPTKKTAKKPTKKTAKKPTKKTTKKTTKKLATIKATEKIIKDKNIDKHEYKLSAYSKLQLRLSSKKKAGKYVNTLKWKKVKKADKYIIYGAICGKKHKIKKLATVKAKTTSWTHKKCKKNTYYKYIVVACKKNKVLCTSKTVHGVASSKKYTNPTGITTRKNKLTIKRGKTIALKAKVKYNKKKKMQNHVAKLRYQSSNKKIVTVSKYGKIKAVSKGKATIYIYTQNGICKKIAVTVK